MANISLDDVKNENIDLERIPVAEVFEQLKCTKGGLTSEEGQKRLQIFGPNKLEEKKRKQDPQVPGIYVESSIVGHGVCCYHGPGFG